MNLIKLSSAQISSQLQGRTNVIDKTAGNLEIKKIFKKLSTCNIKEEKITAEVNHDKEEKNPINISVNSSSHR
ncbi:hypothetical protein T11_17921 [Trichinella zimbabwensis]|uniref:Uncharacterized protein n=1 Tax=Trichinella zimbabwensis TaxID=268475 RepID=A0A0V1HWR3_9BILA|nr:hypothetical protein T11_17921 [Trichinella zimbabwensis]